MPSVQQDVAQIRTAVYGKDVREAIANGIEHCYYDADHSITAANSAASDALTQAGLAAEAAGDANAAAFRAETAVQQIDDIVEEFEDLQNNAVQVVQQSFDDNLKAIARGNIGAASSSDLTNVSNIAMDNRGYIGDLTASIETAEGQITDLKSAIGTVPLGRTVQGQITDHGTRITTLEGDMTDAKRDINALDSEFIDLSVRMGFLEPDATAEDVGKALIAKTVTNGKVSEYEFGETTEIDDTAGEGDTDKTWSADKLSRIGTGLSDPIKDALLACFRGVAWLNWESGGRSLYNELALALYPDSYPKIVATYNPGTHVVYDTDTLDTLKPYITVLYYETADSDGETIDSSSYTLSGLLTAGTSTITVTYNTYGANINVSVATHSLYALPANTSFTRDSDSPIITELKLFENDISYSIIAKGTIDIPDDTLQRVFMVRLNENNKLLLSIGITPSSISFAQNNGVIYTPASPYPAGSYLIAFAFSHIVGSNKYHVKMKFDNHIEQRTNADYVFSTTQNPLVVGAGYDMRETGMAIYNRFTGTLQEFKVLDYAMTTDEINQYVGQ